MAVHGPEELRKEDRLVRRETRAGLMSDTKWRKLIAALEASGLDLRQCVIKFVGCPVEQVIGGPGFRMVIGASARLHRLWPWAYTLAFGFIPLRSIEWLLIPRIAEEHVGPGGTMRRLPQPVDEAARIVAELGRYPIELSERGLLIRGYLT